jgi:FtsZ-interacting cell division protein ZipA
MSVSHLLGPHELTEQKIRQIQVVYRDMYPLIRKSPFRTSADSRSSGLSSGAIGGIVGGIVGGLLIIALILGLLWRRRRRRRNKVAGYGYRKEKESMEDGAEPKVEPYIGRGEVDLGPREGDHLQSEPDTITPTTDRLGSTELERQTKQMLGVSSPSTSTPGPSAITPIPEKSHQAPSPGNPTTTSDPSSTSQASPTTEAERERRSSPVRREQEVEYVRHTDGGMVQVELPPLYSDVPRE